MAEASVLIPLGWLVSPLITILFNKMHDHLGTGIDERRKILAATVLPCLSLAIEKVEKSPNKEKLVDWLNRLKGAYYEAGEAIDLFEYKQLKKQVRNERGTRISLPSQFVPGCLKNTSVKLKYGLSIFSSQKIMLKGCIDKLIDIAKEANEFRDSLEVQENASSSDVDRDTNSEPPSRVFGRKRDIDNIVCLLTKSPSNSEPGPSSRQVLPIIAITGISGVGKTTLAQYVFKYMEGHKHFDLPLWLHAPRRFKATDVLSSMIEKIEAKESTPIYNPSKDLQTLFLQIRRMVGSKKLLLVLDDFWSDTWDFGEQWEKFIGCLSSCSPGSIILLTTQSKNVAQKVVLPNNTEVETYYLRELDEYESFELFMNYAWPSNCHLQNEEFEKIGHKIAVKLRGDPSGAKLVGRRLSEKFNLSEWEKVAEQNWLGDNMQTRIWSYQQLAMEYQRCFAICSLFPKGSMLTRRFLIDLWMAEGFISPIDNEEMMEITGEDYLHELVSRFFLEEVVFNKVKFYQLHDLLHDLAKRVQGDDFMRIDSTNSKEFSSHIKDKLSRIETMRHLRHIYLLASMITKLKEKLCLINNIRTLLVEPDGGFVPKKVLLEIFKNLKKLRVIYLKDCVVHFPYSFGNLKHLRFLDISISRPTKKFPDSICKLYHLQTLVMPNCKSLPKDFSELISLRHFETIGERMSHIFDAGRLTSLQGLDQFVVRKKRGNELHQLKNLNQLRGGLRITGLENVVSTEDAINANMQNKQHLTKLAFEWNSNERDNDNVTGLSTQHVELLDALRPPPNISVLKLKGFGGGRFPNWLQSQNSLMHLTSLTLIDCDEVKEIPSLHPNITYLVIDHIPQLSYFSEVDLLMKEESKQSILDDVKQIAEYLKLEYVPLRKKCQITVRQLLLLVKERLKGAPEICMMSSQYENIIPEIVKFDLSNDDYSRD